MKRISMKDQIQALLQEILKELGISGIVPEVEISADSRHGEYTTNVALKASKILKKSPMEIALQVKEKVESLKLKVESGKPDQNIVHDAQKTSVVFDDKGMLQAIDRVEAVPPGFINIYINEAMLSTQLERVLNEGKGYGMGHVTGDRKQEIRLDGQERIPNTDEPSTYQRIVVEYTDPNPFKEFHVGHLYSNSVGESICRLLESQGDTVRRVNYQGDVGMHVAKVLWGLTKHFQLPNQSSGRSDSKNSIEEVREKLEKLENIPLIERIHVLGQAYAAGAKAFEDPSDAGKLEKEQMKQLNRLIFITAQTIWQEKGKEPVIDYTGGKPVDEEKLSTVRAMFEAGRAWSLEYFETLYKRLGTKFDGYYFESFVGERGLALVREHMKDGVFEKSEGAIIYKGEKKNLHTRVFVNQLGLPTYETKELGLAPSKYDDWPYDRSLIVTGNEINEYFKVLLAALGEVSPELAVKTVHIGHGMVRKADGSKMSSRSGQVLTGEGLLHEVKASIYKILDKNSSKDASYGSLLERHYSSQEREQIAETAAIAAVKYSLLRVSLPSDVAFDTDKSVSFDGDSGPYILYTYTRCRSVVRKAGDKGQEIGDRKNTIQKSFLILNSKPYTLNSEERTIARLIFFFPEIVAESARALAPHVVCTYLFELAQAFNLFYGKHTILGNDNRIALTAATAHVLKNGLYLLGIETVERM